jgi:hypothetical protein
VVSSGGDLVRGVVLGFGPDGLRLRSDLFGELVLPAAQTALVVLREQPLALAQREALDGRPGLLLANGERLAGTVATIDERAVAVDTGRRVLQIPRERVVAVRTAAAASPTAGAWVRLANGDRLCGVPTAAAGALVVEGLCGRRELPAAWLRGGGGCGPARQSLSALPPAATAHQPELGEAPLWLADREVGGGWVMAGGLRAEQALVWRSGQEATWELDGSWQRLVCLVALGDGPGSAAFRVDGDGKALFTSKPIAGRGPARPLAVPLAGVRRLRLAVLPGADGVTAGDRAVWLHPTLVK